MSDKSCCSCGPECCGPQDTSTNSTRTLTIDFLFLDVDVCVPCKGTESSLEEAIADVARVLEAAGVQVIVRKIHVETEEQARELKFLSSPTIRINGRDIQLEVKEALCPSCGDLCGDQVDCRIWVYQGQEYSVPPKAMIVDAILREVYAGSHEQQDKQAEEPFEVPDNLKKFFAAKSKKSSACCCGSSGSTNCC